MSTKGNKSKEHYDKYPFNFMTAKDKMNIVDIQPESFRFFVKQYLKPGQKIADVGCGPGRAILFLVEQVLNVYGIDVSEKSLEIAKSHIERATFICASNLSIPIPDSFFDVVISDGVIHHIPDPFLALSENTRILRKNGYMYLSVYKRKGHYYYMYNYIGALFRYIANNRFGQSLIECTLLPLYYGVHAMKTKGNRTWYGARNLFYDYFFTPYASFYTKQDICDQATKLGLDLISYSGALRNSHTFVFRKI